MIRKRRRKINKKMKQRQLLTGDAANFVECNQSFKNAY